MSGGDDLINPCLCRGSMKYVHTHCLIKWIVQGDKRKCEVCQFKPRLSRKLWISIIKKSRMNLINNYSNNMTCGYWKPVTFYTVYSNFLNSLLYVTYQLNYLAVRLTTYVGCRHSKSMIIMLVCDRRKPTRPWGRLLHFDIKSLWKIKRDFPYLTT